MANLMTRPSPHPLIKVKFKFAWVKVDIVELSLVEIVLLLNCHLLNTALLNSRLLNGRCQVVAVKLSFVEWYHSHNRDMTHVQPKIGLPTLTFAEQRMVRDVNVLV